MFAVEWDHRLKSLNQMLRAGMAVAYSSKKQVRDRATVEVANAIQKGGLPPGPPFTVPMIRFGRGTLDDDNLAAAFKHIRDGVALALGVNDNDPKVVRWMYKQEVAPDYRVRIEIESRHA